MNLPFCISLLETERIHMSTPATCVFLAILHYKMFDCRFSWCSRDREACFKPMQTVLGQVGFCRGCEDLVFGNVLAWGWAGDSCCELPAAWDSQAMRVNSSGCCVSRNIPVAAAGRTFCSLL